MKKFAVIGVVVAGLLFTLGVASEPIHAQSLPSPSVGPAIDGVLAAFGAHPLVGLGAAGTAQEADFYGALVGDPRFVRDIGNVVVEFGGAAHQDTVDRYVAGETVSYNELRKVWTDVVEALPTVVNLGSVNFYAHVRAANLKLPPEQRIHVWLGDPAIDWSKIKTRDDWRPFVAQRDPHAADIIEKEILAKRKKALIIYGGGHFLSMARPGVSTFKALVEKNHPDAFFIAVPYRGFLEKSCAVGFEQGMRERPAPALVTYLQGTVLDKSTRSGCTAYPPGVVADAFLYLGPWATLVYSPIAPDIYLDADYRREIDRRYQLREGKPMPEYMVPLTPAPIRPLAN